LEREATMQQRELGGILFQNDRKKTEAQPDWTGRCTIAGQEWEIAAWAKEGKRGEFLSLKFSEPRERRGDGGGGDDRARDRW
jgi:hypothetical protein